MTTEESQNRRSLTPATQAGLFVALVLPFLIYLAARAIYGEEQPLGRVALGLAAHWANFAAVIAIVLFAERRPLASIGVRPPRWWTIPLGLLAGAVITVAAGVIVNLLGVSADAQMVGRLQSLPFAVRLLLAVTAGVFEETLYRGYALERLASLCGSRWLAAAATLLLFTLMHVPAVGWAHLLPVGVAGLLVTLLYLWRGDLVLNAVAHLTVDGIGLLLVPMIGR